MKTGVWKITDWFPFGTGSTPASIKMASNSINTIANTIDESQSRVFFFGLDSVIAVYFANN